MTQNDYNYLVLFYTHVGQYIRPDSFLYYSESNLKIDESGHLISAPKVYIMNSKENSCIVVTVAETYTDGCSYPDVNVFSYPLSLNFVQAVCTVAHLKEDNPLHDKEILECKYNCNDDMKIFVSKVISSFDTYYTGYFLEEDESFSKDINITLSEREANNLYGLLYKG